MSSKWWLVLAASGLLAFGVAACGDDDDDDDGGSTASGLSGTIRVDGSSTVAPLTEAIAEGFQEDNPDVKVTVGTSGTGGGFEKFCAGETDISDASRPIEPAESEAKPPLSRRSSRRNRRSRKPTERGCPPRRRRKRGSRPGRSPVRSGSKERSAPRLCSCTLQASRVGSPESSSALQPYLWFR